MDIVEWSQKWIIGLELQKYVSAKQYEVFALTIYLAALATLKCSALRVIELRAQCQTTSKNFEDIMGAGKPFDVTGILNAAKTGTLKGPELHKMIKRADDLGLTKVVKDLQLLLVPVVAFAGDAAPAEVRDRIAQGVSALTAMGHTLSRTRQMFKRHGVIETINRIAKYPAATQNYERLRDAGLGHLTAEAIVLDYPDLFSEQALAVAKVRLGR